MRWVTRMDDGLAFSRPGWLWVGQLALVVLGTHRGAERLAGYLARWLAMLPAPWPDPDLPLTLAAVSATGIELCLGLFAIGWLAVCTRQPSVGHQAWLRQASIRAFTVPIYWAATTLAGTWTVALGAADLVGGTSTMLPAFIAVVVLWRVGLPGCLKMARQLPPAPRTKGLVLAPALLLVSGLALRHGLPVWGWL